MLKDKECFEIGEEVTGPKPHTYFSVYTNTFRESVS
jgi:hypothetical protein